MREEVHDSEAPARTHGPVSYTMMLGHLRLQVVPLTSGACSLDYCRISEPAEEPGYGSENEAFFFCLVS